MSAKAFRDSGYSVKAPAVSTERSPKVQQVSIQPPQKARETVTLRAYEMPYQTSLDMRPVESAPSRSGKIRPYSPGLDRICR